MDVLHISAECYPVAKAGGLGDVVGALPKYQAKLGKHAAVVMPKYETKWVESHGFHIVHQGTIRMHTNWIPFTIEKENLDELGFPLYVVSIPGFFDRPGVYMDEQGNAYGDNTERFLCFQQAVLTWVRDSQERPRLLHCHDHHSGLIPFLVKHSPDYWALAQIPTVFTIHNGEYHGSFGWHKIQQMPFIDAGKTGLLDWKNAINPLASALKTAWAVTTVSPTYMEELKVDASGLESLVREESAKCQGILNGIDTQVWDPATDHYIAHRLEGNKIDAFKRANKLVLAERFGINPDYPMVTFIGRFAKEKGADFLPDLVNRIMFSGLDMSIVILGSGDPAITEIFRYKKGHFLGRLGLALEYNEGLAHQLYAGADFLFMPSRVEPCGLNQMYAMRYGTIPIVRTVGGLVDTVPDLYETNGSGRGIRFNMLNLDDMHTAFYRAYRVFQEGYYVSNLRKYIMQVDFSWENSAQQYVNLYNKFL